VYYTVGKFGNFRSEVMMEAEIGIEPDQLTDSRTNRTMPLRGRHAIITGAGLGLGACITEHYVAAGASVMLCARDESRLRGLSERLAPQLIEGQEILFRHADVAVRADMDALVEETIESFGKIDVLVNNAGVYGPFGAIEDIDWDEWVHAMEINVLGTVYPCRLVVPQMKRQGYGKIVNLSGGGATNPLPRVSAYAASKAAVVRFTESLALEVSEYHIDVNAVAPGALNTRMMEQLVSAGPERVGEAFYQRMLKVRDDGGVPLDVGATLCVWFGSAESDGITGRLISAPWDSWRDLPKHVAELAQSDLYTLRRIEPKDRNLDWSK